MTISVRATKPSRSTQEEWHHLDARAHVLGRVASEAARLLMGKHRADYTAHRSLPIHVVISHTDSIHLTGRKESTKRYIHHTGRPRGLRVQTFAQRLRSDSRWVVKTAVFGMLPKNKLRAVRMRRLHLFAHEAESRLPT